MQSNTLGTPQKKNSKILIPQPNAIARSARLRKVKKKLKKIILEGRLSIYPHVNYVHFIFDIQCICSLPLGKHEATDWDLVFKVKLLFCQQQSMH